MNNIDRFLCRTGRLTALLGVLALASCSGGDKDKKAGQSVARVDGYELTVHQLNSELATLPPSASSNEADLKTAALDSLINRQLLIAEAERDKLDRDPDVMQVIERQKGQILVQALLQRKAAHVGKPTPDEVQKYYESNPALFANRKVYDARQLVITGTTLPPELAGLVDAGKPMDELAAWLDKNKVQFANASATRTTADLPRQIVQNLDSVGSGKPFIVREAGRLTIASLHLQKEAPVTEDEARPQIEQYLMNQKVREAAASEVALLRKTAKIEYLNGSASPERASGQIKEADAANQAGSGDQISKGVSALK